MTMTTKEKRLANTGIEIHQHALVTDFHDTRQKTPQHFGSDPACLWIRINAEIGIRMRMLFYEDDV